MNNHWYNEGKEIINQGRTRRQTEGNYKVMGIVLVALVGGMGIHRFYLGYTWQGVVQLLTAGGCGVWALIDLIRICTGDLQPKNGNYAKTF